MMDWISALMNKLLIVGMSMQKYEITIASRHRKYCYD